MDGWWDLHLFFPVVTCDQGEHEFKCEANPAYASTATEHQFKCEANAAYGPGTATHTQVNDGRRVNECVSADGAEMSDVYDYVEVL